MPRSSYSSSTSTSQLNPWEAHRAVKDNRLSFIKDQFASENFDLNTRFHGQTLLTLCVIDDRREVAQLLLELGANPNIKSNEGGRYEPSLITAVRLKNINLVRLLLQYSADLTITDFYGRDAIFHAVLENADEILQYLLNYHCESPLSLEDSLNVQAHHNHHHLKLCPLYLSLTESFMFPLKKRSFLRLLQFQHHHYPCLQVLCGRVYSSQLVRDSHQYNYSLEISPNNTLPGSGEGAIKVDTEIILWAYLSLGYPCLQAQLQGLVQMQQLNTQQKGKNTEQKEYNSEKYLEQTMKLTNLTRITLRKMSAVTAAKNKVGFLDVINDLGLPKSLVDFLLLKDIQFVYERKTNNSNS